MRRKDREVTAPDEIEQILRQCQVLRVAVIDGDTPYIIPYNFGYEFSDGQLNLIFHSARSGRAVDLLQDGVKVGFEMDIEQGMIPAPDACNFGFAYSSLIGSGTIRRLTESADKKRALLLLMKHLTGEAQFTFPDVEIERTSVFQILVSEYSAKRRPPVNGFGSEVRCETV